MIPLAIYRDAGIDKEQEKKIRQLAKEFEDGQRVRLALMANLLKDMRNLQMQPDPNEKTALAKQDEINKVQAEMGTERTKLVLKIRNVLDFEQKQRLIRTYASLVSNYQIERY
jgi:Zn-dependent M16 (insulinase) family peptidase